ncbi:CGNR zinc finger domain-containing protein [Kocuria flava]|uniref:CGNR zinc finger domain-containing protein n=1 Tax=Kocuria flava TaxID=446860 RepID=UPI000C7DE758|nr:CGNR zinc finger domain-containing protein [Kocuria flava]
MDPLDALEAALELINSRPLGRRPDALEHLRDISPQLLELVPRQKATSANDTPAWRSIAEVRQLRDTLALALLAGTSTQAHQTLEELMDINPPEASLDRTPEPLAAELAQALIPLLQRAATEGALQWVLVCPDPACRTVFLNRAHNRRRRYCSPRCGTRARMARHRQRQSG